MANNMDEKINIPLNRAILWILFSTLLISGSAFMGWLYYLHIREKRYHDDQYNIVAILQSTLQADSLKTSYLAEILHLSLDRPMNLYQFNVRESVQLLLDHPLIKEANIKKILPGTLYIQYQMRTPLAFIGDFTNTAIDDEGYLFPFRPFFTPKWIPTIYLGVDQTDYHWGSSIQNLLKVQLAFDLLSQFKNLSQEKFDLKLLDVSQAFAESYGKRQVVMQLEEKGEIKGEETLFSSLFLRLSSDHIPQDLVNFNTLQRKYLEKGKPHFQKGPIVMDFRLPHLAFIKHFK